MNETFRPGFGRGLTVVLGILAALTLAVVANRSGVEDALLTLPWAALFMSCCWAIFWRPRVDVSDAGVRLVNVTRTIDVPWPAVNDVETRYALTLDTAYGRFAAWAAPAPGAGPALRTAMRNRPRRVDPGGVVGNDVNTGGAPDGSSNEAITSATMGELAGTPSGDAAMIIRRRWERLRDAGFLDDPQLEFAKVPIQWHWKLAAGVAVLSAISVATLFVA